MVPVMARLLPAVTKARKLVRAEVLDLGLKADKCRYSGVYQKEDLRTYSEKEYAIVNVQDLNCFDNGTIVTIELLMMAGLVNKVTAGVKLLGEGELEKKLTVQVQKCSRQAEEKLTAKGGKFEVI